MSHTVSGKDFGDVNFAQKQLSKEQIKLLLKL